MNKSRKPSTERNSGQRVPPRRTSNVSLQVPNEIPKILSARDKSPQIVQVEPAISRTEVPAVRENDEQRMPKTRFVPQDGQRKLRSSSSPRLKSFPAEVIKADCSPILPSKPIGALIAQQDPEQNGAYLVAEQNQAGHGDQMSQLYRRQLAHANQGQQQVSPQQSSPMNPQFEGAANRQGIDKELHHPYVPNVPHGMSVRDQTPRLRGGTAALPSHAHQSPRQYTYMQMQPTIELMEESKMQKANNVQDEWVTEERNSTPNLEKQPVGGRNAVAHRKIMMQDKQQQIAIPQEQLIQQPMESMSANYTPVVNQVPNTMSDTVQICQRSIARGHSGQVNSKHYPDAQNPQHVYSQLQQNIAHQRQMQQNALTQQASMLNAPNHLRPHGSYSSQPGAMTSPQDVNVNQLKESRGIVDPNSRQFRQNSGLSRQNGWIQDNRVIADHPSVRAQLKPFAIDLVNNNNQRQLQPQQYQQYQQPQPPQMPHTPAIQYSQPAKAVTTQQTQQNVHQGQVPQMAHQQQIRRPEGKKSLQFTPEMLHDQELLVTTMRQQRIPDDLMRRQFDTLLQEQRRQLAYIKQFRQSNENEEPIKSVEPVVRKKSRVDEKPEWMIHLTPPRVSYDEIERMRREKYASLDSGGQGQITNEQEMQEYNQMQQVATQQGINHVPVTNQHNWPVQQMRPQLEPQSHPNTHQQWHQSPAPQPSQSPSTYYNMQQQVPARHGRSASASALPTAMPPQILTQQLTQQYQQPQYQMYTPQNDNYQMQQYQQQWQSAHTPANVPSNPRSLRDSQSYDHMGRPSEPSSLLKLKVYKDFIKPQRRNNGLQDPDTIQKAVESLKTLEGKAGYEYLANLRKPGRIMKLNGTQDPLEMNPEIQSRYMMDIAPPARKKVPSNGLENTRDPNDPPYRSILRRKNFEEPVERYEYPRQRQSNQKNVYSVTTVKNSYPIQQYQQFQQPQRSHQLHQLQQAQYERTMSATNQMQAACNPMSALNSSAPFRFESSQPQYYQQVQQFQRNRQHLNNNNNGQGDVVAAQRADLPGTINANRAGGDTAENSSDLPRRTAPSKANFAPASYPVDPARMMNGNYARPEICEARTIGGVTFLARKPEYAPPNQLLQEGLGPRYVQPLVMY